MNDSTSCPDYVTNVNITNRPHVIIILAMTCSFLAVFIAASNIIIIVALCRQRALTPQNAQRPGGNSSPPSQLLMVSMAVSDAIIGLLSMPLGIYVIANNGRWELGNYMCSVWNWLDKVLCTVSIYHVAFMALDRYFAVCRPMMYLIMTKKTTLCLIALSWGVPTVVTTVLMAGGWHRNDVSLMADCLEVAGACAPIYNHNYLIAVSILDFYVPFLVIFILYFLVAREIYRHRKKPISESVMNKTTIVKTKSVIRLVRNAKKNNEDKKENMEMKHRSVSDEKPSESTKSDVFSPDTVPTREVKNTENNKIKAQGDSEISGALFSETEPRSENNSASLDPDALHPLVSVKQVVKEEVVAHNSISVSENLSLQKFGDISATSKEIGSKVLGVENSLTGDIGPTYVNQQMKSPCNEVILDSRTLKSERSISIVSISPVNLTEADIERQNDVHGNFRNPINNRRQKYVLNGNGSDESSPTEPEVLPTKLAVKQRRNANKAFTTIGCIVVCFTICWLPFSIYNFVYIYSGFDMDSWPFLLFTWMGYTNSAMNPIFYCFTDSVRQAVVVILKWPKKRKYNYAVDF